MDSNATDTGIPVTDPGAITDLGEFVDSFMGTTKSLISAEREYITFLVSKRTAEAVRLVAGYMATFVFHGAAVLLVSLGCAYWLAQELDNVVLGFACVAGGYVLLGIVFGVLWKGGLGRRFVTGLMNKFHGNQ